MAKRLSSWEDLVGLQEDLRSRKGPFLYRGQNCTLPLSTSFERQAARYGVPPNQRGLREKHLIREFQRHYHRFSVHVPAEDDLDRWLSLMQHHGAPTRALDFTYSFWVAVFFAVERMNPGEHGSLWWFAWRSASEVASGEIPDLVEELNRDPKLGAVPGLVSRILDLNLDLLLTFAPHALDERLAIQQGAHLVPLTLRKPIKEVAEATLSEEILGHVELCLDREALIEVLSRLQDMNIERRVLFPGLDGLAEGLNHRMGLDHLFPPGGDKG